jgi:SAM-dependent methyltransferase
MQDITTRQLPDAEARALGAGSDHYTAFVGPPSQYDLMGASQFMLLLTLGLRDHHRVLDFGCGSLRAGRFLITYLQQGKYYGLEPNSWLIDDAIDRQIGRDQINIKSPTFYKFTDFTADKCENNFDFIIAQSIFSHSGTDFIEKMLREFQRSLAESGLCLATFIHPEQLDGTEFSGSGWVYPDCVSHSPSTILNIAAKAGLMARALPWFHSWQTWYGLSRNPECVPGSELDRYLRGPILNVPAWRGSL